MCKYLLLSSPCLSSLGIGFSRFLSTILQICSFMCPSDRHQLVFNQSSVIKSFEAVIEEIQRALENYGQNIIKKEGRNVNVTVMNKSTEPKVMNKWCFSIRHWGTQANPQSHCTEYGYHPSRVPGAPSRDSERMGGARNSHSIQTPSILKKAS